MPLSLMRSVIRRPRRWWGPSGVAFLPISGTLTQTEADDTLSSTNAPIVSSLNRVYSFTNQSTWTIPGTTHLLGHAALRVQVWDAGTPRRRIVPSIMINPGTLDVIVTFAQPQSGQVVINGARPFS